MRVRRLWTAVVGAVTLAVGLAACGGSTDNEPGGGPSSADPGAALSAGWSVGIQSLDPHMQTSAVVGARFGLALIYDRLFTIGPDGTVKGYLAGSWTYGDGGRALKIKIRDDAKFRDGTSLDAKAVKANLDRARTLDSPVVKSQMSPVTAVKVTAPYEVTLTLAEPTTTIPAVLSQMAGFIMNPTLIGKGDPAAQADGSGAYVLKDFTPNEKLSLVRQGTYWNPNGAKFASFTSRVYTDRQAMVNAVTGGQIDVAQLTPDQLEGVEGKPGLKVVVIPQGTSADLALNFASAPLDDVRVRQALNYAMDRDGLVKAFFPDSPIKWQNFRKGTPGFDPALENSYPYNPAKAKELLAQAGHPNGLDIGTVIVASAVPKPVVEAVQGRLKAVGLTATFETVDSIEAFQRFAAGKDAGMLHYFTHGLSPVLGMRDGFASKSRNPAGTTPEFDSLIKAADNNRLDNGGANKAAQAVNRYVVEQAWRVPIAWQNYPWVMNDKVQGISPGLDYANLDAPAYWATGVWKSK